MKPLLYLLFPFFLFNSLFSQQVSWVRYTTQNSPLPNDFVTSLLVDEYNNKWIGTGGGLVKYNDNNWVIYDTSNSGIPMNYVLSLAEDEEGKIWVGTSDGLASFDGTNWNVYHPGNSGLPAEMITALKTIGTGIWVGAMDHVGYVNGGLAYFDGNDWTVYKKETSPLPDNRVMSINISPDSAVWIGTINGLARFENGSWTVYQQDSSGLNANDDIEAISFDSGGNMWLACKAMYQILNPPLDGGLAVFDGERKWDIFTYHNAPFPWHANSVENVYVDKFENVWASLWYQGRAVDSLFGIAIVRYNHNHEWTIYEHDYSTFVRAIVMDDSNHIWLGAWYGLTELVDPSITAIKSPEYNNTPFNYSLDQNFPNPFNPVTTIKYQLPQAGFVTLKVYDVLGNEVASLVNGQKNSGSYSVDFDASKMASGVYIYQLRVNQYLSSRKMLLLK